MTKKFMLLTKTNYLLYRDCPQNAWVKIFEPEKYDKQLSDFAKMIIETGNEVDKIARDLFPGGILMKNIRDSKKTMKLVKDQAKIIYQPVFFTEKFEAICDIIVWNEEKKAYDIYEAKSTNSDNENGGSKKNTETYTYDLAFQVNVLKELGVPINKTYIIRLNRDYVRGEKLDIKELLIVEDFTEAVMNITDEVLEEMKNVHDLLKKENKPNGSCSCIVKGRSAHCVSFQYLNPQVPEYSVHDISRIGNSKKKLAELVDSGIYSIYDVPEDFELTEIQRNQVDVAQSKKIIIDNVGLNNFLKDIKYPISFIDYETFPSAIPRFAGYRPYQQIPFQFSLHVLEKEGADLKHFEFLHTEKNNPDLFFLEALKKVLPKKGSIIVWNKSFECGINDKLAERNNEHMSFVADFNSRVIDLEDPFKNQFYVHPGFSGKTSIKKVLPTLAPSFSYKTLNIQEGGTASETWNKIISGKYNDKIIKEKSKDLLAYCELDTLAMVEIWKHCISK